LSCRPAPHVKGAAPTAGAKKTLDQRPCRASNSRRTRFRRERARNLPLSHGRSAAVTACETMGTGSERFEEDLGKSQSGEVRSPVFSQALGSTLGEYVPRVYRFALRLTRDRHEAEDLTQETMLRAWRARRRLREPKAAAVWLLQIAANLWRDRLRKKGRRPQPAGPLESEPAGPPALPEQGLADEEDLRRALAAMDALPPRQREVLYLHACEGLAQAEIAAVLRISTQSVKASLSLARQKIRRQLEDVCRDRFPRM